MSGNNRLVGLSSEAEEDLLDIWHFGANEWSPEQADRHLRDLDDMFERLRENPKLGHNRDDLIAGLRSTFVRPHLVFYRHSPQGIDVVRILHERFDTTMYFRQ
jgi:toxin ParE1/3/4